jgi:hypothetical protein
MSEAGHTLEYMSETLTQTAESPAICAPADVTDPRVVPLERLEAQICELAGHLAAATARFLALVADFDARRGH